MKRFLTASVVAWAVVSGMTSVAQACPMCKYANEADQHDEAANRRPKAFMYSILFMLSMPPMIFTGFGVYFYQLRKQADLEVGGTELPGETL